MRRLPPLWLVIIALPLLVPAAILLSVMSSSEPLDRHGVIVVAAGSDQYAELAQRYKEVLARFGVHLIVRLTTPYKDRDGRTTLRPLEGRITLRALVDDESGITAGFVKGNLAGGLQGTLATETQKGRHA